MAIPPAMMKEQEDIRNRFTCALFSSFHFFLCFFLPLFFYVVPFCCVGKRSRSSLLVSLFESKSEEKKERMKRERERERERERMKPLERKTRIKSRRAAIIPPTLQIYTDRFVFDL